MSNMAINFLYNIYKNQLTEFRNNDIKNINVNIKEEYNKKINDINKSYDLYFEKLNYINRIKENEKVMYYMQTIKIISNLENIDDKKKCLMIISYGVLFNLYVDMNDRPLNEVFMLSVSFININIENYKQYMNIIGNSYISKLIIEKTSDIAEQENIAYKIINSIDNFENEYLISKENFNEILNIIKSYQLSNKKIIKN